MHHSKLIKLLATLSRNELKRFEQYINSPFFNTRKQPIILFNYLKKNYPKWIKLYKQWAATFPEQEELIQKLNIHLGKQNVFQALFPKEKYKDEKMRRIMSYCTKLLEGFLQQLQLESEESKTIRQRLSLKHHLKRREFETFEDHLKQVKQQQKSIHYKDSEFYQHEYLTEYLANSYRIQRGEIQDSYNVLCQNLDTFFLLSKLRLFCAMLTRQKQLKVNYQFNMMEEIASYVERHTFEETPLIRVYYYIMKMELDTASQEDINTLTVLLNEYKTKIPHNEMRQVYGFMINYLIRKSRDEGEKHFHTIFDLIKTMIKEEYIYVNNALTTQYFSLCVKVAAKTKAYNWAEDFIYKHEDKLTGKDKEEIFTYNLLEILFHKKDFDQILKRIDKVKMKHPRYQIFIRILKLKTLYENRNVIQLFLLIDALKKFIKNKSKGNIGSTDLKLFLNFVTLTEKLAKSKFDQRPLYQQVLQRIYNSNTIEKEWLVDKYHELASTIHP